MNGGLVRSVFEPHHRFEALDVEFAPSREFVEGLDVAIDIFHVVWRSLVKDVDSRGDHQRHRDIEQSGLQSQALATEIHLFIIEDWGHQNYYYGGYLK